MIKRVAAAICLTLTLFILTGLIPEQLGRDTVLPTAPKVQASSHEPNRCSTKSDQIVKVERFELKNVSNGIEISFRLRSDVYLDGDRQYFRVKIYRINEDGWGAIAGNQGTFAEPYEAPITIGGFAQDMRERTASGKHVDKTVKLNETRDYLIWGDVTNYELYPNCSASKSMKYQSGGTDVDKDTPPCVTNLRPVKKKKEDQVVGFHQVYLNWDFNWPNKPADAVVEFRQNYIVPAMGLVPETPFTKNEGLVRLLNIRDETKFQILAFNKTKGNFRSDCKSISFFSTEAGGPYKWVDQNGTSHDVEAGEFANDASGGGGINGVGETPPPTTQQDAEPDIGDAPIPGLGAYISDPDGFVYKSWRVTRAMINILLIIALMVISFSNITRINLDTYTIKKALPNIIIGVVLANASFLIIRYFADIVTVITYFFAEQTGRTGKDAFGNFLADAVRIIGFESIETTVAISGFLAPLIILIVGLVAVIGVLWLAFILYFRLVAIYLLTILSPLAFVSYGIPGLEKYFKQWWQQFIKWLFIVPAIAAVLWLMIRIGQATEGNNSVAKLLILYVLFFTALTLPSKMGGAVIDRASKAFMKYSGAGWARDASQKAAADGIKDAGRWVGSRTPGLYRIQEWNKLRKANFEKDLELRKKSAETAARSGRLGRKAATLGYKDSVVSNRLASINAEQETGALTAALANSINSSEIAKTTAEKLKDKKKDYEKLRYLAERENNPEIKKLIEKYAEASSQAGALNEAVSSEEKQIIGGYTNTRYDILKSAKAHADLEKAEENERKALEEIAKNNPHGRASTEYIDASKAYKDNRRQRLADLTELEKSFEANKGSHPDLSNKSIRDVAQAIRDETIEGKIFTAESKKQGAGYDKGIEAQSEDMRKEGSIELLAQENTKFFKPDPAFMATMEKLASGRTVGLDIKTQREFDLMIYTMKDWLKSNRNPNHNGAIENLLNILVKQGKQELKYMDRKGNQRIINASNVDSIMSDIDKLNNKDKSNIVKALYQQPAVGGSPSRHVQNSTGKA